MRYTLSWRVTASLPTSTRVAAVVVNVQVRCEYPGPIAMFLLQRHGNLGLRLSLGLRAYAKISVNRPWVGLEHLSSRKPNMEGRQPSPAEGPASKKPRLTSPPRSTTAPDTSDVPMDGLDANNASALATGGETSAPAAATSAKAPKKKGRKQKQKHTLPEHCSAEDVVARDIAALLGSDAISAAVEAGDEWDAPFDRDPQAEKEVVEIEIKVLSSNGRSVSSSGYPSKGRL
jgi:hypothetical protein